MEQTTSRIESPTGSERSAAVEEARACYAAARPRTRAQHVQAEQVLPGGNTRTVLYSRPFPLRVSRAWDDLLEDVDGHIYVDLLGEYSAGLYGHSHPIVIAAMVAALHEGVSRGAHTPHEVAMAEAVCDRFPALERVRFTNSGTEANLMALSVARAFTGRSRVLVFNGAYHGGLLTFAAGGSKVNAPYDVVLAPYNDLDATVDLLRTHAADLACVLIEPMLGSGGCIPAEPAFLPAVREVTREVGALLIVDEVMTSRTGAAGLAARLGVRPDLMTLGKYLGGGSSFGAFGGRAEIMACFDPSAPGALPHAGTFNNNVVSMAAGHAGLTRVYPPDVAERHTARGDALRDEMNRLFRTADAPFSVTGVGSLMTIHATPERVRRPEDLAGADPQLSELLFLDLLDAGWYIAPRGYLALSLALSEEHLSGFVGAVSAWLHRRQSLWR